MKTQKKPSRPSKVKKAAAAAKPAVRAKTLVTEKRPGLTAAYAAQASDTPLAPFQIRRRQPRPQDVQLEILYCGVCHSDIHMARNEWGQTIYPVVPGHEIVGRVTAVGNRVTKFREGDLESSGDAQENRRSILVVEEGLLARV